MGLYKTREADLHENAVEVLATLAHEFAVDGPTREMGLTEDDSALQDRCKTVS